MKRTQGLLIISISQIDYFQIIADKRPSHMSAFLEAMTVCHDGTFASSNFWGLKLVTLSKASMGIWEGISPQVFLAIVLGPRMLREPTADPSATRVFEPNAVFSMIG
jgi:hypothetical protein